MNSIRRLTKNLRAVRRNDGSYTIEKRKTTHNGADKWEAIASCPKFRDEK